MLFDAVKTFTGETKAKRTFLLGVDLQSMFQIFVISRELIDLLTNRTEANVTLILALVSHVSVSICYQVSLQGLENFLCLFHYVQHHPNHSTKEALIFW